MENQDQSKQLESKELQNQSLPTPDVDPDKVPNISENSEIGKNENKNLQSTILVVSRVESHSNNYKNIRVSILDIR